MASYLSKTPFLSVFTFCIKPQINNGSEKPFKPMFYIFVTS